MFSHCATCGESTDKVGDNCYVCSNGHENWLNPSPGATVFVIDEGRVLYGVRSRDPGKGLLDLPGGFIEVGETAEAAAVRESKEEVGLDVALIKCLGTYTSLYEGRPILNVTYISRVTGGELRAGDDMSGGEPQWRDIDDLPQPHELAAEWFVDAQSDLQRLWTGGLEAELARR